MYCHEAWFATFVMVGSLRRDKLGRKGGNDDMKTLELLGWRPWRHMIFQTCFIADIRMFMNFLIGFDNKSL